MPRVLVVDDNVDLRMLLALELRSLGFEVVEAGDAKETEHAAERDRPDAIVLDLHLPRVNGFEVCRRLKADRATAAIPVIAVTAAYRGSDDRHAVFDAGADAFMQKPIDVRQLVETIRRLCPKETA